MMLPVGSWRPGEHPVVTHRRFACEPGPPGGPAPARRAVPALGFALGSLLLLVGCSDRPTARAAEEPLPAVAARRSEPDNVSALGRIEPEDGLIRVAGPSGTSAVIGRLYVDDGDPVKKGQLIATLDTLDELEAKVESLDAEYANARREHQRHLELHSSKAISDSQRDEWEMRVRVAHSKLQEARAALARARVLSPIDGRVIRVHARESERVGDDGIVEIGRVDRMFAIAEVYETDVGRVRVGQKAVVTSPVLAAPLTGTVDWVHLQVAKQDRLGTDPAARKDARVVEVEVRLDDSAAAAAYTNLEVEVEIAP
jgi:HlyD family secretion protein